MQNRTSAKTINLDNIINNLAHCSEQDKATIAIPLITLCISICDAVKQLHDSGQIHGHLSSENILVNPETMCVVAITLSDDELESQQSDIAALGTIFNQLLLINLDSIDGLKPHKNTITSLIEEMQSIHPISIENSIKKLKDIKINLESLELEEKSNIVRDFNANKIALKKTLENLKDMEASPLSLKYNEVEDKLRVVEIDKYMSIEDMSIFNEYAQRIITISVLEILQHQLAVGQEILEKKLTKLQQSPEKKAANIQRLQQAIGNNGEPADRNTFSGLSFHIETLLGSPSVTPTSLNEVYSDFNALTNNVTNKIKDIDDNRNLLSQFKEWISDTLKKVFGGTPSTRTTLCSIFSQTHTFFDNQRRVFNQTHADNDNLKITTPLTPFQ